MKHFGYSGKILRINLSNKKIKIEETLNYVKKFLGGKGINQWILLKEVKPGIWPLDPINRLIFGAGVLDGTLAPGSCRYNVDSKNAFTGGVGSSSSGGHLGPEMKFAGYDNIIIQGRSRNPCYLWIDDEHVEFKNANHLWGKTTWENDTLIREEIGDEDIKIASIGQAGENLVRAACIINNGGRAAGRCGLGAVMGSKNLKAIAVRGSGEINVANPDEFMELVEELWNKQIEEIEEDRPAYIGWDRSRGFTWMRNTISGNQVRNFQDGFWDLEKVKKTSYAELQKYQIKNIACFSCPTPCMGATWLRITEGEFKGIEGEGIYDNTVRNFGVKIDNENLESIIAAHIYCSQYGLDIDNTAGPIAWAMECYQRGILTKDDTDGLELEWGNYKAVLALIKKIAFREGFGDVLGEGCKRASEIVGRGSEKFCMHVKGQDLYENIRATIGYGFGTIIAPRGGGHLDGAIFTEDSGYGAEMSMKKFGVPTAGDRLSYKGKPELVVYQENWNVILNCLGICIFMRKCFDQPWVEPYPNFEILAKLYSAATGFNMTSKDLIQVAERIINVMKVFNVREGMTRKDDYPPDRFFNEPIKSGPGKGVCLERKKYDEMLNKYYMLREWDKYTGIPTNKKFKELQLLNI